MPTNVKSHRPARAANTIGRQPTRMDRFVNIGPALVCSSVTRLCGRPYPIQFRAQGALDAWTHALGNTGLWPRWQASRTLCWEIRQEVLSQVECMHPRSSIAGQINAEDHQRLAFQVSLNLKYHLSKGQSSRPRPRLKRCWRIRTSILVSR